MPRTRRPSGQTLSVLAALSADPAAWRHGYELGAEVGLRSGSLYPILVRLADRGLLDAVWEDEPGVGRPARHLYRLTGRGREYAAQYAGAGESAPRRSPRPALGGAS